MKRTFWQRHTIDDQCIFKKIDTFQIKFLRKRPRINSINNKPIRRFFEFGNTSFLIFLVRLKMPLISLKNMLVYIFKFRAFKWNSNLVIPILLWFTIMLVSCDNKIYYNLDHNKWFVYNEGDTLMYRNNFAVDTFVVSQIINDYRISDKKYYYEGLIVIFKKVTYNYDSVYFKFNDIQRHHDALYINWRNLDSRISYPINKTQEYVINGVTVKDVIKVATDTSFQDINENDVKLVYYTDKYGIIAYTLANDKVFELDTSYLKAK